MDLTIFFGSEHKTKTLKFLQSIPKYQITYDSNIKIIHKYAVFYRFTWSLIDLSKKIHVIVSIPDCPNIFHSNINYQLSHGKLYLDNSWENYITYNNIFL